MLFARHSEEGAPALTFDKKQVEEFRTLLMGDAPNSSLLKNMDRMLNCGELFTMAVYAQLVLEGAKLNNVEDEPTDQMFACFVKDMNKYALAQMNNRVNTEIQNEHLRKIALLGPVIDSDRVFKFRQKGVKNSKT